MQEEKSSIGFERMEEGLARARASIRQAIRSRSCKSYKHYEAFVPRGDVYLNPYAFHQLRFFISNF